jgi:hypothetical protein
MSVRLTRFLAVGATVVVAEAVWLIAVAVLGIPLQTPAGSGYPEPVDIDPVTVAVATIVLSLVGWAALAGLEWLTASARRTWLVLAVLALFGSLAMPLSGTGVSAANRIALVTMHVLVAAIVIAVLYRVARGLPRKPRTAIPVADGTAP